ncbi:hypothetical protein BGZ51_004992 [Haplosporangium sp. Z 767]|nr:hypothetical protein BGZ51_004992 [Haplosporangium sp. Z 767]KAF9182949.1 hypothetical protein BGZ50_004611 [Haplosporangium sp. Z 11]
MRLRAKIQRNLLFFKLAQAVEKIGRSCFIKFTREYVAFGAQSGLGDDPTGGVGAVQCWSRIGKEMLFHEYKVESNANNEIYLEMKVEDLLLAMRTSANASAVMMRMTGRSADAYLTFVITTEDHMGNSRPITQNVPIVKIMSADGASNTTVFSEPEVPDPELHIMLPQLDRLRNIASSYKSVADYVVISANLVGEMVLTTSDGVNQFANPPGTNDTRSSFLSTRYSPAEKAHVETRFSGLHIPKLSEEDTMHIENEHPHLTRLRTRPKEFVSTMVRVTDLQKVLQSQYVKPTNVVCCLVPNYAIIFYVYLKDVDTHNATLTYFIPEDA